ncbi:MAG: hypothetical protein HKN19_19315 [Halioglobus sp.]|nr:hypothetical protein [Halioglobus sp.]
MMLRLPARILLVLFSALLSLPATAAGSMYLNRSIVTFSSEGSARDDVLVINAEEDNLYVSLEVFEVKYPGTVKEERVQTNDPQEAGLIVTPNKLIVPPLGRKLVRLVNLEQGETERIYRVNVTPIVPPLENPQNSFVRVIVAYQLLVIVQPDSPVEDLKVERVDGELRFFNAGNTNVLLGEGSQCDEQGLHCVELPTKRIYAGNSFSLPLQYNTPVSYKLTSVDATRQETF